MGRLGTRLSPISCAKIFNRRDLGPDLECSQRRQCQVWHKKTALPCCPKCSCRACGGVQRVVNGRSGVSMSFFELAGVATGSISSARRGSFLRRRGPVDPLTAKGRFRHGGVDPSAAVWPGKDLHSRGQVQAGGYQTVRLSFLRKSGMHRHCMGRLIGRHLRRGSSRPNAI